MYTLDDLSKYLIAENDTVITILDLDFSHRGVLKVPHAGYVHNKKLIPSDKETLIRALHLVMLEESSFYDIKDTPEEMIPVLLKRLSSKILQLCLELPEKDIQLLASGCKHPYLIQAWASVFRNYRAYAAQYDLNEEADRLHSTLYFILSPSPYKQLRLTYKQLCTSSMSMVEVLRRLHRSGIDIYTLARAAHITPELMRSLITQECTLSSHSTQRLRAIFNGSGYRDADIEEL